MPPHNAPALERLRTFVSAETGIVHGLAEELHAPDEYRAVMLGAHSARAEQTIGSGVETWNGSARPDREAAEAAAIAEALERYSAAYVPDEQLLFGSASELQDAVEPSQFALFSKRQYASDSFPYAAFDDRARVRWVEGRSLADGKRALVPAQLVYSTFSARTETETAIGYCTSSGAACGATADDATLSALLELVERDAFMIVWRDRLSLPLLDWSGDDELARLDQRYFAPTGLDYRVVDMSALTASPCLFATVRGPEGRPGSFGIGAACAPTVAGAWWRALSEAFAVHRWVRDRAYTTPEWLEITPREITTFRDHSMYYANPANLEKTAFLDCSPETTSATAIEPLPGSTAAEQLSAAVEALARKGISSVAVDVTAPDVRAGGIFVARAVCPPLCQLDVFPRVLFLGSRRLTHAAWEAGLLVRPLEEVELNYDPHPFP